MNIIGRLPVRYTGTRDDKIVVIGSHYGTVQTSPGVADNGSGMTAFLQALKLFTSPGDISFWDYFYFFVCEVDPEQVVRDAVAYPVLVALATRSISTRSPWMQF